MKRNFTKNFTIKLGKMEFEAVNNLSRIDRVSKATTLRTLVFDYIEEHKPINLEYNDFEILDIPLLYVQFNFVVTEEQFDIITELAYQEEVDKKDIIRLILIKALEEMGYF